MSWFQLDKRTFIQKVFGKIITQGPVPKHVAFIMDGNRRYAKNNKVEKIEGHKSGFDKLGETLVWCHAIGVREVTVYAFSIENFKRSKTEVDELFALAKEKFQKLLSEKDNIQKAQICIRVFGDLSLMPQDIQGLIAQIMDLTKNNKKSFLNICCAYTSREEMALGCKDICKGVNNAVLNLEDINENLIEKCLYTGNSLNVDLIYRTSGEVRLSDFLLWQCNNCTLSFVKKLWPEFSVWDFYKGVLKYQVNYNFINHIEKFTKNHPSQYRNMIESNKNKSEDVDSSDVFLRNLNKQRIEHIEILAQNSNT